MPITYLFTGRLKSTPDKGSTLTDRRSPPSRVCDTRTFSDGAARGSGIGRAAFELRPIYERLIEKDICGRTKDERRAIRQAKAKPILDALHPWLQAQLERVSSGSKIADGKRLRRRLPVTPSIPIITKNGERALALSR